MDRSSPDKAKTRKKLRFLLIIPAVLAVIIIFNIIINRFVFTACYTFSSRLIDDNLDGYRIVQLSDVHSVRSESQKEYLINKVRKAAPDIIVVTGDLIDSAHYSRQLSLYAEGEIDTVEELTIEFMSELTLIAPVYFIYGNHEMMLLDDVDNNPFSTALKESGVIFLNNETAYINVNGSILKLSGIQDPATLYKDPRYAFAGSNADKTRAVLDDLAASDQDGSRGSEASLSVLLAHRPEFLYIYRDYDIDLVLSGHTHGGIMRFPFGRGLYARSEGFFPKYSYGEYTLDGLTMIINGGLYQDPGEGLQSAGDRCCNALKGIRR